MTPPRRSPGRRAARSSDNVDVVRQRRCRSESGRGAGDGRLGAGPPRRRRTGTPSRQATTSTSYDRDVVVPSRDGGRSGSGAGPGSDAASAGRARKRGTGRSRTRPARSRPEAERQPECRPGSQRSVTSYPSRPLTGDVLLRRTPNTDYYACCQAPCQSSLWGTIPAGSVPIGVSCPPVEGCARGEVHAATRKPADTGGYARGTTSAVVVPLVCRRLSGGTATRLPDRAAADRGARAQRTPTRPAGRPRRVPDPPQRLGRPGAAARR